MKMIEEIMKKLNCTEEEAIQLLEDDKKIDKGEKLFELSADQKVVEKKMKNTGSKAPTAYKFQKRERKADNDKRFLIDAIYWLLTTDIEQAGDNVNAQDVKIVNQEREILFTYNEKKYKIVLSAPRS
jgi:hypothetical protein